MESLSDQPRPVLEGQVGPDRQLPSGANKVERIAQHTKGLVSDLTEWVELKMELVQLEVEEKVEQKINQAVVGGVLALMALLVLVFGLVALALGLGAWLGHPAWGFLMVTILLALITVILLKLRPRLIQIGKPSSTDRSPGA